MKMGLIFVKRSEMLRAMVFMLCCLSCCVEGMFFDETIRNISRKENYLPNRKIWFDRLRVFSLFKQEEKENILLRALFNDARLATDSLEIRSLLVESMLKKPSVQFEKMLHISMSRKLEVENFLRELVDMWSAFCQIPGTRVLERSFALNISLFCSGLCPLMMFSFDNWKNIGSEMDLIDLIELSTSFLYRLVDCSLPVGDESGKFLGSGGYSNVFLSQDAVTISKVPRNFAQFSFGADEEFAVSRLLEDSSVSAYIPKLVEYDPSTKIIKRSFINDGVDGVTLLKDPKSLLEDFVGLNQIKEFYLYACLLWDKFGINLDIHPGNFLWSPSHKQWFFVDIGPMPKIGAEYFPRNNFDLYFEKVWRDLLRLMVDVPIRSVDVAMDFAEIAPFRAKLSSFLKEIGVKDEKKEKG